MTTNLPQDDIFESKDFYEVCQLYRHAKDNADAAKAFEILKDFIRTQRQQGSEPDGELCDCTHTVNHCTDADNCRVVKKLIAYGKATHGIADTKATPPQANALVAAAYRKAAEICEGNAIAWAKVPVTMDDMPYPCDVSKECKDLIIAAIPADAEAALRELCMKVATAVRMQALSGPIERDEIEAIVNSVLGDGGK
jgi:hypothetical protein